MSSHENNSQPEDDLLYLSFHSDAPVYGGAHFVGSPGQITLGEPNISHMRPIPSYSSLPSSTLRPGLGRDRSVSLIVAHTPPLEFNMASSQNLRESLGRLSRVRPPPPESQWSLFEQLMENEGQLRSPIARDRRRLVNSSHRSEHSSAGPPTSEATSTDCDPFDNVLHPQEASFEQSNGHCDPTESEDESQPCSDSSSATSVPTSPSRHWFPPLQVPTIPVLWKNVLKCAVAYLIASLFTFSPYLSGFLSDISTPGAGNGLPSPTGHMIATMYASSFTSILVVTLIIRSAVYYNPAKTMGGMMEADSYCSIAFLYAAFVCLGSMSMFWYLEVRPGWEWLGDALAILWVGVSMWGLTWMRAWMTKPTFNSGMSITGSNSCLYRLSISV
jgi:hypothetical protein